MNYTSTINQLIQVIRLDFQNVVLYGHNIALLWDAEAHKFVCVCTIHQNVKLMISALLSMMDSSITYHELMKQLVCSVNLKLCMIHRCLNCPGTEQLEAFIRTACKVNAADEMVNYKQWLTTDITTLEEHSKSLDEFIDTLVHKCDQLTAHHYIAIKASIYLSKKFETRY